MDYYLEKLKKELKKHHKNITFVLVPVNETPKIESNFISDEIVSEINKHNKVVKIDLPKIEMKILYKDKLPKKSIQNIINRFHTVLSFMDDHKLKYNKNKFKLLFIPTNAKKKLPIKNKPLSSHHVNSGSSYIFQNDIMIWRQEECEKVFIHELFHCLGFDRFAINNGYVVPQFKITKHQNYNEGYNELCACIYNCCFQSIENKKNVSKIFKHNQLHSLHQIKQLLQHHNFHSLNDLKNNIFPQDSSAFSYYILKGMYLYNLKELLKYLPNQVYLFPLEGHRGDMDNINNILCQDNSFDGLIKYLIKNNMYKENYSTRMTV